jgi:hypothetical protein
MQVVLAHNPPDGIIADITQSFGNSADRSSAQTLAAALGLTDQEFDAQRSHR